MSDLLKPVEKDMDTWRWVPALVFTPFALLLVLVVVNVFYDTLSKEMATKNVELAMLPTNINTATIARLEQKACHPAHEHHSGCLVVKKDGSVHLLDAYDMVYDGGKVVLEVRATRGESVTPSAYGKGRMSAEELQRSFRQVIFRDDPDYGYYAEAYFTRSGA